MRKWAPLLAVCLGTFMLLLDVTVVIVALPDIASSLDASLTDLQWVIDAYALALAALLLGAGVAGDVLGRRRVYAGGTALFALASLACGLASNTSVLIAMRALQGIGGAAMFATTLSLLAAAYQGRERSVALGMWGAVAGAAAALGPILGGVLTQSLDWRWIFFINLPVSVAAIWLTLRGVAESRNPAARRIDWAGTATFAVFTGAVTFAVVRAATVGWVSTRTAVTLAVAVLALVAFVLVERRTAEPLLDLSLFRRPSFVAVMAGGLAFNATAFGVMPYTSVWLQTVLEMSPVRAGLALVPMAVASFVVAAVAGRLLHGVSPRPVVGGGLLLVGVGLLAQAMIDAGSDWSVLIAGLTVAGIGVGLVSPALAGAALASVPARNAGMAGGAVNTFRQFGFALGVAVFGSVGTSAMARSLDGTVPDAQGAAHALAGGAAPALREAGVPEAALRAAFASGLNSAAVVAGVTGLAAGLAVLAFLRPQRPGPEAAPGPGPEKSAGEPVAEQVGG